MGPTAMSENDPERTLTRNVSRLGFWTTESLGDETMIRIAAAATTLLISTPALAQGETSVTIDNFAVAESHLYFANMIKETGGIGKILHNRTPVQIDKQDVIRQNRDTLYSHAVFDL